MITWALLPSSIKKKTESRAQQCISSDLRGANFKHFLGEHALEFLGSSGTRNTGHLWLSSNLLQVSNFLETLRLESSVSLMYPFPSACVSSLWS